MSEPIINRIYNLKIAGYDDSLAQIEALTNAFTHLDEVKRKLNSQLQEKLSAGDTDAVTQLSKKIQELEQQMAKLKTQRDSAAKEQALLAKAEKDQADAYLKTQKAAESLAKTEQIRISTAISQEKELDRQIALEEKQALQLAKEKAATDALEGSYTRLKEQRKQLESFAANGNQSSSFNFNGNVIGYDEVIAKIKEIKAQEQQYLDQLKIEKESQAAIIKGLQDKIVQIKIQRLELEKIASTSQAGQTVTVRGQTINYEDAITQINTLKAAETQLTENLATQGLETKSLSNNYYSLLAAQRDALTLYRNTEFTSPIFQEVKEQAQAAAEKVQAFNRSLSPDGTLVGEYKSGIINAFKNLGLTDVLKNQRGQLQAEFDQLKSQNESLVAEYRRAGSAGTTAFKDVESQLKRNVEQQEQIRQSLNALDNSLRNTGSVGTQISTGIAEGFKNVKAQLGQVVLAYVGFQAIFQGALNLLHTNTELSDSYAQLKIYIHGTTEEANNLVEALKKIPTRTSLPNLVDIATAVAQKGVAKEQIGEVTQAFDQLFTALGKDAGDPHQGVLTIAKLISIFHDDHEVTAQRVKELGNAMFTLQSSGPVSGEFLQGFAERVGAVRSITGASIPQILGMGAAFQQLGQTEEVAGSASSRLLTQLIGNVEKFAAISGISVEKLRAVIKVNPFEGLLEVAEKLKDKGAEGVEAIVKLVGELPGLNNVRVRGAFSELINNADLFRQKMDLAGTSLTVTSGLTTAFEEKQKTFGATIAEIGKEFQVAFSNQNFINALNGISKVLLGIIQMITAIPFSVVVGGITAMSAAWLFYKGNLTLTRLEQMANNEATLLGYVRLNLLKSGLFGAAAAEQARAASMNKTNVALTGKILSIRSEIAAETASIATLEARVAADAEQAGVLGGEIIARRAHVAALESEVVALESATAATDGLNVATKASPLGIILGILALIVPAISVFGRSTNAATKEISEQNKQLRLNQQIQGEVAKSVAESSQSQISHVSQLVAVLKDHTSETYLLKKAYDALISIAPEFAGVYDGEKVNLERLNELYPIYIANLKAVSEAKALSSIRDKYEQEKADAEVAAFQAKLKADQENEDNKLIDVQNKKAAQNFFNSGVGAAAPSLTERAISDAAQKDLLLKQAAVKKASDQAAALDAFLKDDFDKRKQRIADLTAQLSKLKKGTDEYNQLNSQLETQKKSLELVSGIPDTSGGVGGRTIAQIKADLKKANQDFDNAINGSPEKAELKKKIESLTKELIDAGGKKAPKEPIYKGSRLSGIQKDLFKDIDASRDQQITEQKLAFKQLQEDEETYLTNMLQINTDAANKKIALLKGSNAEERKQISDQKLFIIEQEEETDKKLFDLQKKKLDANLAANKTQAQVSLDKINNDVNKTDQEKRKAKSDFLAEEYLLESTYDAQIDNLETRYNQKSVENAQKRKDALIAIQQEIKKTDIDIAVGTLQAIDDSTEKSITEIKLKYDKLVQDILKTTKSTQSKTAAIKILTTTENVEVGGAQLKGDVGKVLAAKQLLDFGLITKKQFEDIYAAANKGQQELNNAIEEGKTSITSMAAVLGNSLGNLFGFDKESGQAQVLAQTISDAFGTAKNAMDSYFQAESNNIEHSNQIAQKRIDIELQQAKSKAQSQAEQDSLDQQFQAKRDAENKKSFEQNKKLQIEQAKINLAIQLSNLAVIAFAPNPLNIATLGVAGTIMYAIQAALAIANYALNVSKIKSAQFAAAEGGKVPGRSNRSSSSDHSSYTSYNTSAITPEDEEPLPNGKIRKRQNIPTQPNGDNIFATVRTGEVILNEDQQRKAGGDAFFKKLGVPGFASGGAVSNLSRNHIEDASERTETRTINILTNTNTTEKEKAISLHKIFFEETLQLLKVNKELASISVENKKTQSLKNVQVQNEISTEQSKLKYAEVAIKSFIREHDHSFVNVARQSFNNVSEKVSSVFNRKNITSLNAEVIKLAASSLIKNKVDETKTHFFKTKMHEIGKVTDRKEMAVRKQYINQENVEKNRETMNVALSKIENIKNSGREQKKDVAKEKLAIDLHGHLITIKEKVPVPVSFIPAFKVQNKYNRDIQNISKVISTIEHPIYISNLDEGKPVNTFFSSIKNFFTGGKIEKLRDGKIIAPPNIPEQSNGDNILATVRHDEVILNKEQQKKAGGDEFFRRLGVPGFADGGRVMDVRAFATGGYTGMSSELGSSLKAPENPQSYLSGNSSNSKQLEENSQQIAELASIVYETGRQVHERIDKLQVILDPGKVERANNKTKKATAIGKL